MVLDAARVEQETGAGGSPELRRLPDQAFGYAGHVRGPRRIPFATVRLYLIEADGVRVDERAIDPAVFDHQVQHAGKQRGIAPRLDREVQVARPRQRRDAWILHDDPGAQLARLPDVVGRNRRALRDVRARDPDHLGPDHVRPRVGGPIDAKRLLVRGAGADHAQAAVVVDVRRAETDARKLAEQVGLFGREARAAEHAD